MGFGFRGFDFFAFAEVDFAEVDFGGVDDDLDLFDFPPPVGLGLETLLLIDFTLDLFAAAPLPPDFEDFADCSFGFFFLLCPCCRPLARWASQLLGSLGVDTLWGFFGLEPEVGLATEAELDSDDGLEPEEDRFVCFRFDFWSFRGGWLRRVTFRGDGFTPTNSNSKIRRSGSTIATRTSISSPSRYWLSCLKPDSVRLARSY